MVRKSKSDSGETGVDSEEHEGAEDFGKMTESRRALCFGGLRGALTKGWKRK
jgi:hypothetical protein